MVSTGTRGSSVKVGFWPAAIATIIVSPTARDDASTTAATIPESAAGNTTLVATSLRLVTSGVIMIPITSPALIELKVLNPVNHVCNSGVTNVSAKKP